MATYDTVLQTLEALSKVYPRFTVADVQGMAEAYAVLLVDLDDDLLKAAAQQCATTGTFFPSVAELRKAALEIRDRADGTPNAEEAWLEVQQAMHDSYYNRTPPWSHELIGRAVEAMGGWWNLCSSETGMADRAHFLRIYGAFAERHEQTRAILPQVREVIARLGATRRKELPCPQP